MKVCQVDTGVISDILEDKKAQIAFEKFIVETNSVIGLSTYTFYELFKREKIYNNFLTVFPPKRIAILKPSEMLLKEEIDSYPNNIIIEPIFVPPTENFNMINSVFTSDKMKKMYSYLDENKNIVLDRILFLKTSYPPNKSGKYSREDRILFVKKVTNQQLEKVNNSWYKSIETETFDFSFFKSLTAQLYISFYKFYLLKERKSKTSDIVDISISASFPYVDFILTEKNLVHDIKQIQNQKFQFDNVTAYTLEDIKIAYA